jgi:hypothetical protein
VTRPLGRVGSRNFLKFAEGHREKYAKILIRDGHNAYVLTEAQVLGHILD